MFTRTKHGADKVARHLEAAGISDAAIHGNKSQSQRERALAAFRAARSACWSRPTSPRAASTSTHVTHVVNFELPNVPESYVHRIGRTARAGAAGIAISLCDAEEREFLRDIERLTRQSIPTTDRRRDPTLPLTETTREARPRNGKPQRGSHGEGKGKPRGGRNQRSEHRNYDQDRHNGDRRPNRDAPRNASPAPSREPYANQVANGASLSNVAFLTTPTTRPGHATQRDDSRRGPPRREGKSGGKRYSSQGGGYRAR